MILGEEWIFLIKLKNLLVTDTFLLKKECHSPRKGGRIHFKLLSITIHSLLLDIYLSQGKFLNIDTVTEHSMLIWHVTMLIFCCYICTCIYVYILDYFASWLYFLINTLKIHCYFVFFSTLQKYLEYFNILKIGRLLIVRANFIFWGMYSLKLSWNRNTYPTLSIAVVAQIPC